MGLGNLIQKAVVNLAVSNKDKLLALFLQRLDKEYYNNRAQIAAGVVEHLPEAWKDTASRDEIAALLDILKKFIEDIYTIIQQMQQPEVVGPMPPRSGRV